jgi:hypothetical protein
LSDSRLPRAVAWAWGAAVVGSASLVPFAGRLAATLPACPVRSASGLPCPACGSGRALLALADLDPLAALAANPLATLGAAIFVLGGIAAVVAELSRRPLPEPRQLPAWVRVALPATLIANWAYVVWQLT